MKVRTAGGKKEGERERSDQKASCSFLYPSLKTSAQLAVVGSCTRWLLLGDFGRNRRVQRAVKLGSKARRKQKALQCAGLGLRNFWIGRGKKERSPPLFFFLLLFFPFPLPLNRPAFLGTAVSSFCFLPRESAAVSLVACGMLFGLTCLG